MPVLLIQGSEVEPIRCVETICDNSSVSDAANVDASVMLGDSDDKSERSKEMEEENGQAGELLGKILYWLKCKKYSKAYGQIIAASNYAVESIYQELFRAVFEEYNKDFSENGISDPFLENLLIILKSYGTIKDKLTVVLECSDRANSLKTFVMLGSFMEEIMPEMVDLRDHFICDIVKVYIPSWIQRLEKNIALNHPNDHLNRKYFSNLEADYLGQNYDPALPDVPSDPFLAAVFMFLRIFTLSTSTNYKLLDELLDKVLACTHIESCYLKVLMVKLDEIYKFFDRRLPFTTLLLVNSLKSKYYSFPQVFSPEYYLKLALGPLRHSLHISTSNMFNIGYVVLVLRNCLISIVDESIGRNQCSTFLEFLADFLICCEESTLGEVRAVCLDTFKTFLSKFEPVAQVLIIRKLFDMIRKGEIQLKFESHYFAWMIDLFRSKLNYEVFRKELGFFWGDIVGISYSSLSDGLQYYVSAFIFAQEQALRKINPELMLNIYKLYLQPLKSQISDWTELMKIDEQQTSDGSFKEPADKLAVNMERLERETRRQQDRQSLPLLHFQYSETLNFVATFLRSVHML
uniref:Uncharacterized protein n=1 Tax=Elaeophora elaphi TaxID=1147741 RepID=A0A0R3RGM7_9BILA